ncbi:MAG TPA: hypothetical protein DCY13_15645 [Verrucomicrobiales bacterium]|nr:hypothetical protein [Verrucomicrobiales bacterium]
MKLFRILRPLGVSMLACACLHSGQPGHAAEKAAARSTRESTARPTLISNIVAEIEIPLAEFVADIRDRRGRDPFFPDAKYWQAKETKPQVEQPKDDGGAALEPLKITGMGGIGDRRWAMINGVTIYVGENAIIRVGAKAYDVVCHEMTDKSVIVGIKGSNARREIKID